jgi:hypothetical protein
VVRKQNCPVVLYRLHGLFAIGGKSWLVQIGSDLLMFSFMALKKMETIESSGIKLFQLFFE